MGDGKVDIELEKLVEELKNVSVNDWKFRRKESKDYFTGIRTDYIYTLELAERTIEVKSCQDGSLIRLTQLRIYENNEEVLVFSDVGKQAEELYHHIAKAKEREEADKKAALLQDITTKLKPEGA